MERQHTNKVENIKDILLLLLYVPGVTQKFNEPIRGRTRITKLMFLFVQEYYKRFDFDKKIHESPEKLFVPYKYGPFSEELFSNLEFFENIDFISGEPDARGDVPLAEIEEMEEFDEGLLLENLPSARSDREYQEDVFRLTKKGENYAQQLYDDLSERQKDALRDLKTKYGSISLFSLLQYVYKLYPKYTTESEITGRFP
jgi:hypothetical protein